MTLPARRLLYDIYTEFSNDKCSTMAASIAYFAIFALPPVMVIVMNVAGTFIDPQDVSSRVTEEMRRMIGERGAAQINTMMQGAVRATEGTFAKIVGMLALALGATGLVLQLQIALNVAWNVEPDPTQGGIKNFVFKRLLSFAMVLAVGVLLLASMLISTFVNVFGDYYVGLVFGEYSKLLMRVVNNGLTFAITTVLFATLFKLLPDAKVHWRDVWLGAFITAILFTLGQWGMGYYFGKSDLGSSFGAAASLVLVMMWIYYTALIMLIGAEFTQIWARSTRAVEPAPGARLGSKAPAASR